MPNEPNSICGHSGDRRRTIQGARRLLRPLAPHRPFGQIPDEPLTHRRHHPLRHLPALPAPTRPDTPQQLGLRLCRHDGRPLSPRIRDFVAGKPPPLHYSNPRPRYREAAEPIRGRAVPIALEYATVAKRGIADTSSRTCRRIFGARMELLRQAAPNSKPPPRLLTVWLATAVPHTSTHRPSWAVPPN
jgi:hypothetical protein